MEKNYLVELNVLKKMRFMTYRKFYWTIFPETFIFEVPSWMVNGACMQKIKFGHRAKFWARNKYFAQILFPVRVILRKI